MAENRNRLLPKVTIVGRPNVGKSSLFNRLSRSRQAIVYMERGTTRDRIDLEVIFNNKRFILTDTGGFIIQDNDRMSRLVKQQIKKAIEESDYLLFVCDGQSGLHPQDLEFAGLIRKANKPIFLVVNKVDNNKISENTVDFYRLGFNSLYPVSSLHDLGIEELMLKLTEKFSESGLETVAPGTVRVAIVGRPNVGKSSFVNCLLDEERVIVDNIPGTTRDTIDTFLKVEDNDYVLVDTAGIRHKRKVKEAVDVYSMLRTKDAIRRSDACITLIDAFDGIVGDDLKIPDFVIREGKCLLIAVNKWDLIKGISIEDYKERLYSRADFLRKYPILFVSAKTGYNVYNSLKKVKEILGNSSTRIPTSNLNRIINSIKSKGPFAARSNQVKLNYATQTGVYPPTFLIFVNNPRAVSESQQNYIENNIRKNYDFFGAPVKIDFRSDKGGDR